MPIFNRYRYDPPVDKSLTRYVALDPALDPQAPLRCTLTSNRPSVQDGGYCAISYVWGKQEFPFNLEIRDNGDTSYLRISATVDGLLRCFRLQNRPRTLWIDALCIDQESEMDKARQIPLMGKIYQEATDVLIWLGPEDNMTRGLFKFFRKISQIPHLSPSEMSTRKQWDMAGRIARLSRIHIKGTGNSALGDIIRFFERPWFSRRWVIQEAYLAAQASVHCGRLSIPLSIIISAATHLQVFDISWYAVKMTVSLGQPIVGNGLLELLWNFHEAACLEQKDRIAALICLVDDHQRFDLDFIVHWTRLYEQVARIALHQHSRDSKFQFLLHLFEFGPITHFSNSFYPSWIPDWSRVRRRKLPYYSRHRNPDTYEPYPNAPKSFAQNTLAFRNNELQVHWHSSAGGSKGRQLVYVSPSQDDQQDGEYKGGRTLRVLHQLFPSISDSIPHIITLALLVQTIVEYRHPEFSQEPRNEYLNEYIRDISGHLHQPRDVQTVAALGRLDVLLENLCLCELEPLTSESPITRTFGFSTVPLQYGDAMIPLWLTEDLFPSIKYDSREPGQLLTMLVVRLDEKQQSPPHKNRNSDQETLRRKGRIIGPTVCIISDGIFDNDAKRHVNIDHSCEDTTKQFSMLLY